MGIKLVAIDIDGTLVNNQRIITPKVAESLKKARQQGVYIVLCTGRPLMGVEKYLTELELLGAEDYAITYNGGLVVNTNTGEVVVEQGLTRAQYLEVDTLARSLNVHLHTSDKSAIYTSNRDISRYTINEAFLVDMPVRYRTPEEIANEVQPVKMMMIDEPEYLNEVIEKIPAEYFEKYNLVKSTPFYLEVLNKETSKGNAVRALADKLGIAQAEVMAIGDEENDLTMIDYAGLGVAMGNATEAVKKISQAIVGTNEEDGVSQAIERFVLN